MKIQDRDGWFWRHEKELKEKRRQAPDASEFDYIPNYNEAHAYVPDLMSDADLLQAQQEKHKLVWDTEFYPNYALLGFKDTCTGKIIAFEKYRHHGHGFKDVEKLKWITQNFTLIGFNDTAFDIPMLIATVAGLTTDQLMKCVDHLIVGKDHKGTRPWQFYKDMSLVPYDIDHIDLIALTPLGPGLKTCAGRMHAPRMADLPFEIGIDLNAKQIEVLRYYWINDLQNTELLYATHKTAIGLRELMTEEYGVDVRSKSDPQIAEAVIRKEIMRLDKDRKFIQRATIIPWRSFRYQPPAYLQYSSETMRWVLAHVCAQDFVINDRGGVEMPPELEGLSVKIGNNGYKMGIGGLHSEEKRVIYKSDENGQLRDYDVTSYYPTMMIQQKMFPPNVGPEFLTVFIKIVNRRIAAKKAGDKATAETLKIVANGTFGKTMEKGGYSVIYYPEMGIQTTVTGQLSLLLLIEWLELGGIPVVSANTDGIVMKCPPDKEELRDIITKAWEDRTGLALESKDYKELYIRDVNNYVALLYKPDEKEKTPYRWAKAKGAYAQTLGVYPMKVNPTCEVCSEAMIEFLATGRPIDDYVRSCTDVRKFIEMRLVRGGACKPGEYLGKAVRWYYAKGIDDPILNAKNGNHVPKSHGARPCMIMPSEMPDDIDYDYYVKRAEEMLEDFYPLPVKENRYAKKQEGVQKFFW